ncbi:MAG TPA: TMEM175 family protein [Gemmatimonadaceae bacterium]|nr:TMEM175 family protein [Gemmatimonadaceae bacterium]
MSKGRLEAFTDGVIAIIITILVLEFRPPHGETLEALRPLIPTALSYVLSFVFVAIYWNNHHHLLHAVRQVDGRILWANIHLLFWLSLTPFATAWMGDTHFATLPVALYGADLFMAGVAFTILVRLLISRHGQQSTLARAIGADRKGWISLTMYGLAIPLAFVSRWISLAIYVTVALIWLIPDTRIERILMEGSASAQAAD